VVSQQAATPGKKIKANHEGSNVPYLYECQPEDAAILVFTARDKRSGGPVQIEVESAKDGAGNDYLFRQEWRDALNLVVIKRGFSETPRSVRLTITNVDPRYAKSHPQIVLTALAAPHRFFSPPTASEAKKLEKIARVEFDDRRGYLSVTCIEKPPKNQHEWANPIATSLGSPTWGLPPVYRTQSDAVKVEVGRELESMSETTLTYKNAELIYVNGKPFLSLPTNQVIGTIFHHRILLGNKIPSPNGRYFAGGGRSDQVVQMHWDNELQPSRFQFAADSGRLKLVAITPDIDHLGIDSLHVQLGYHTQVSYGSDGFAFTAVASKKPIRSEPVLIPEIKFRLQIIKQKRESVQTIVLPVHHVANGFSNLEHPKIG
jgi:hypothetical protein